MIATKPKVVCLCGSTRFMDLFHAAGWEFTLRGVIVLSVGVAKHIATKDGGHAAETLGPGVADRLDELHLRKIDLADYVFVLDGNGYIGESTAREILYAERNAIPVRRMGKTIKLRSELADRVDEVVIEFENTGQINHPDDPDREPE